MMKILAGIQETGEESFDNIGNSTLENENFKENLQLKTRATEKIFSDTVSKKKNKLILKGFLLKKNFKR